ncbi:MAG: ester cyclase [Planctomycetota bacterium]|jgi:predicted ester cyclase
MAGRIQLLVGMLIGASLIIMGCESTKETKLERNKELVRRAGEEIFNKGNLELLEEFYSVDIVRHFLPDGSEIHGLDKLRNRIRGHLTAFPDWMEKIELIVAEGDFVTIHFSSTGINTGSFLGNPPTGRQIHTNDMSIYRIVDGKIVEHWLLPDLFSLNQQLGLISRSQ